MTVDLLLEIEVLLEQLVPLALADVLTLLVLFNDSSGLHVLLTLVLEEV